VLPLILLIAVHLTDKYDSSWLIT